jgi:osmoprotectant transport system permease protein
MLDYLLRYHDRLTAALLRHVAIVGVTMAISLVLACALTLLADWGGKRLSRVLLRFFSAVYAIPSLALFAILIPVLGIGFKTAVFVLVLYNQFLLLRNFLAGLDGVDAAIVEAATGLGMTRLQLLVQVKVPLALPVLIAGVRLAVISTIGIGTIAAVVNAGGIGSVLFDGLRTTNPVKIAWGAILSALLAILANAGLSALEKKTGSGQ